MRCDRVQDLYEDYVRSALDAAAMSSIEEHLAVCPACRIAYERAEALTHLIARHADIPHPGPQYFGDLTSRVLRQLDEPADEAASTVREAASSEWEARSRWFMMWLRRPLWWAGGLAAAALLALGLLPRLERGPALQASLSGRFSASRTLTSPEHQVAQASLPLPRSTLNGAPSTDGGLISILSLPGLQLTSSTASAVRTIAKGVMEGQRSAAARRLASAATDRAPSAARTSDMKLVSTHAPAARDLPPELLQQIERIKTQMVAAGDGDALKKSLHQLTEAAEQRGDDKNTLAALPWVREARLYLKADDELAAGHPKEAGTDYSNILLIDDASPDHPSPLALRAALQLADLYYGEWADFRAARENYVRVAAPQAAEALTAVEREHVARQLERLDKYAGNGWEALQLLHLVRREDWPEATSALRKLIDAPEAAPLLPEASRALADRLAAGSPKAPAATALEIYKLLAKRAGVEQNGDIRAWLELALGDMALTQKDPQQAIENYRQAVADGAQSAAGQSARGKLDDLIERQLNNLVR